MQLMPNYFCYLLNLNLDSCAYNVDPPECCAILKLIHTATPDKTVAPACRPPPPWRRKLRLAARPPTRSDVVRHAKCKHALRGPIYKISYDYLTIMPQIDLRRTSNLQNILQRTQGFSWVRLTCRVVRSSYVSSRVSLRYSWEKLSTTFVTVASRSYDTLTIILW